MLMLLRAELPDVRESLSELMTDPDPAVARPAVHWRRIMQRIDLSMKELAAMRRRPATDQQFIWQLPSYYLLRCNDNVAVGRALRAELLRFERSKSARVRWHVRRLMGSTAWAEFSDAAPIPPSAQRYVQDLRQT
jgi:hypothetical protein